MKSYATKYLVMFCLLTLLAASGCSLGGNKDDSWRFTKALDVRRVIGSKKDEPALPQTPTRLVSTWTDTVLHRQGEKPQRGFGGRLLFFNDESEDPIRVDGQLVVYAYDDNHREAHETQPTRRYVFPQQQFVRHESESKLGPSYSFWLPWDEVGGEQKNIDLIARFEPLQGSLIVGEQTSHLLPGTRQLASSEESPSTQPIGDIRLAQYSQESKLSPIKSSHESEQPKTTSIALNRSWKQRLNSSASKSILTTTGSAATVHPGPARQ